MPGQATQEADATAATQTASVENQGAGTSERPKSIPIPTDKWGELNRSLTAARRELDEFKRGASGNLTKTEATGLDPESEKALDLIADRVDARNAGVRDDLDKLNFDRRIAELRDDESLSRIPSGDIAEELGRLGRANPSMGRAELLDRAIDNTILKAVKSGTYGQTVQEAALQEARDELADRGRAASSRRSATSRDDTADTDVESMTAQQLADSGKLDEEFTRIYGRKSRR